MPFIAASQRIYETGEGTAGFLKLPEGTFRADANGTLTQASSGQYFLGSSPALPGTFFTGYRTWNPTAKRWLPVPAQQVATDGATYVYQAGPDVHLVTVATGADKVIYHQPSDMPPINLAGLWLLAYVDGVVYLSVNSVYKGPGGSLQSIPPDQVGVWRIDPAVRPPSRVLTTGGSVSGGTRGVIGLIANDGKALWAVEDDSSSPPTGTLMRYDLGTAQVARWFSVAGDGMDLLGFDSGGNAIVWTYDYQGGLRIWIVSAPDTANAIDSETYSGNVPFYAGNNSEFGSLVTDSYGVWFGSISGLFLYNQAGFRKVVPATGIPIGQCL